MRLLICALFAVGLAVNPTESRAADRFLVPSIIIRVINEYCDSGSAYADARTVCEKQDNICWAGAHADTCNLYSCIASQLEQIGFLCSEIAEDVRRRVQSQVDNGWCWYACA